MTYKDIPGWFDFETFYDRMVEWAVDGARFVEIGCWLGKSTAYLAQKIQASGKRIILLAVDTWKGSPNEPLQVEQAAARNLYHEFLNNLAACGLAFEACQGRYALAVESRRAAKLVPKAQFDFVFIDADHGYQALRADIEAWLPAVKPGGVLAGHDWCTYESVRRAVGDTLPGYRVDGNVWWCEADLRRSNA